jgi:hypothetical protein
MLTNLEKQELIGMLALKHNTTLEDNVLKVEEKEINMKKGELVDRVNISAHHGLDYARLYKNWDGGYSLEDLKKTLQRMKAENDLIDDL